MICKKLLERTKIFYSKAHMAPKTHVHIQWYTPAFAFSCSWFMYLCNSEACSDLTRLNMKACHAQDVNLVISNTAMKVQAHIVPYRT